MDLDNMQPHTEAVGTGGGSVTSTHRGTACIDGIKLQPVLFIPQFPRKLISVARVVNDGVSFSVGHENRLIYQGKELLVEQFGNLYKLRQQPKEALIIYEDAMKWHRHYGHLPIWMFASIKEAPNDLGTYTSFQCESCIKAKHQKPMAPADAGVRSNHVGQLIHSDLCGPLPVEGYNRTRYIISLVDDFSRLAMTTAIRNKSDTEKAIIIMLDTFERRFDCKVAEIRTDHGGEYQRPIEEFKTRGITIRPTVPYHSETNAVAERFNRTIMAMIRAQLAGSKCPKNLWPLAMEYSTFVKNRIPHKVLKGRSPLEVADPAIDIIEQRRQFKPFGEQVYVHVYKYNKLGDRATEARIMGFTGTHGTYKVMRPNRSISTAKDPTTRVPQDRTETGTETPYYIEIDEPYSDFVPYTDTVNDTPVVTTTPVNTKPATITGQFSVTPVRSRIPTPKVRTPRVPTPTLDTIVVQHDQTEWAKAGMTWPQWLQSRRIQRETQQQETQLRQDTATSRPRRDLKPIVRLEDDPKYLQGGSRRSGSQLKVTEDTGTNETHLTMAEALAGPQSALWKAARDREIAQLERYKVFSWVDKVPPGKKSIDTKWVLKEKLEKEKDDPKRFKARLTARGFTQRKGIDYFATYAPVAREETWRLAISIALSSKLIIEVADIEGAFLNGPLEEELYIQDPHATGHRAWRLLRAIYGLKQAARNWNLVLHDLLLGLGFIQCPDEPGLYSRGGEMVVGHVDDIFVALYTQDSIDQFFNSLSGYITIERKGQPHTLLGMEIT